jgi:predicted oxidoreductase
MGVEKLRASIERYNGFCAAGEDTDFGRVPETLLPVDNPPYYAFALYPGLCTTLGGPKKNEYAQVLDGADNIIPRLYCAGSISNFQAHTYGLSGGGNGENMVWGRIAARHACGLESWDA